MEEEFLGGSMMYLEGKRFQDDRGVVIYNNDFDMSEIKRSYIIEHDRRFIRAFHGHLHERKWVQVLEGRFKIVVFKLMEINEIDTWVPELCTQEVHYLENDGDVLAIPAGFTNGFQNLTTSGKIQFFSDKTVEESLGDDIRSKWDSTGGLIWELENYR